MKMRLPKKENVWVTGKTDPIRLHYQPIIGYFMNKRLEGALRLLGTEHCHRLLDIGYGGGVFLPELSARCGELYGVDIHTNVDMVQGMLSKEHVKAELMCADATSLPFRDGYFDRVVCVSVLEFIKDLDKAFSEMARVLKNGGNAVIGFPVVSVLTDIAFLMIGINSRKAHPVDQNDIITCAEKYFDIEMLRTFPLQLPLKISLFAHCRLRKKDG